MVNKLHPIDSFVMLLPEVVTSDKEWDGERTANKQKDIQRWKRTSMCVWMSEGEGNSKQYIKHGIYTVSKSHAIYIVDGQEIHDVLKSW